MGCGKSVVGVLVAQRAGAPFHDLDFVIENEAGMPVSDIFRTRGEAAFRAMESRLLPTVLQPGAVVALGGGAPIAIAVPAHWGPAAVGALRGALRAIGAHSESTLMIGDRMDTDVHSGIEAGLQTILVLTGISTRESAERYPYRPTLVIDSIADLVGHTRDPFRTV